MRYVQLLIKSDIERSDSERKAFLYILSSSESLYNKLNLVYNLSKNQVIFFNQKLKGEFTVSERLLLRLAYNLFNGYADEYTTPRETFHFDDDIRFIAFNAILTRFNAEMSIKLINAKS